MSEQERLEQAVAGCGDRIVYFAQAGPGGPIKIGISRRANLAQRMSALQVGSAWPVKVTRTFPGTRALESALHRLFGPARMEGEWFWPIRPLVEVAHASPAPLEAACG